MGTPDEVFQGKSVSAGFPINYPFTIFLKEQFFKAHVISYVMFYFVEFI